MIQLDLTRREAELLADALDDYLSDLRMEISDTDSQDFRDRLKERKAALRKALDAVRAQL